MTSSPLGYPEPYHAGGWQEAPPPAPVDGVAVAALVTGVLSLGPVPLALGIAGMSRTRRSGTRGRGLAVAGLVLGALQTVALVVAGVVLWTAWSQSRPLPADVSAARDAYVGQVVVGNCLATLPDDGDVSLVRVVPCDDAHVARVTSEYRFAERAVWTGQRDADDLVARSCVLTPDEVEAGARTVTWAPTQESWGRGDRTGLCLVVTAGD